MLALVGTLSAAGVKKNVEAVCEAICGCVSVRGSNDSVRTEQLRHTERKRAGRTRSRCGGSTDSTDRSRDGRGAPGGLKRSWTVSSAGAAAWRIPNHSDEERLCGIYADVATGSWTAIVAGRKTSVGVGEQQSGSRREQRPGIKDHRRQCR